MCESIVVGVLAAVCEQYRQSYYKTINLHNNLRIREYPTQAHRITERLRFRGCPILKRWWEKRQSSNLNKQNEIFVAKHAIHPHLTD